MKQILMKAFGLVMIAGALTATSCKKGDAGPQGEKGDSAIANVYYSDWTDVTFGATDAYGEIDAPKLTQDVLDKGDIRVYWNFGSKSSPYIQACPSNLYYNDSTTFIITPEFYVGTIGLQANYLGLSSTTNSAGEAVRQFRYILIPGGTKARTSINWNNYAEVKAALNIKD
ncbi:hypothetical protein SAMN05421788_108160 [Filimonas lacunae]|uniref:Collagen triple helix repeat-containing protein n=1 Tax=Filimonas lacunae TaxID=477680 RepID=A0A173ME30_9BACT|nr:hypothetical protein [Filimonas lacunae]BAV05691.1 hypothetical protein FLA_1703 [Filimonas lacunae]SIT28886.1 hypothetical protein SAMN05421788_108160 [Filimonas lacunae]